MQHTLAIYTEQELADFLKVAQGTLKNARCSGVNHIPFIRVGGAIRYRMDDVLAYLESRKVEANATC